MASGGMSITADTTVSLLTDAVSYTSVQSTDTVTAASSSPATDKAAQAAPVDTVAISNAAQDTQQEPRTTEVTAKKADKQAVRPEANVRKMGDVLFEYNLQGDLRIRFMDSKNMLIYQIPPLLVAKTVDLMEQFSDTVNTKV